MAEKEGNSGSSVILLDFVIRTTSRSNIFAIYRLIFRTADISIPGSREILSRPYLILYLAAVPTKLAAPISIWEAVWPLETVFSRKYELQNLYIHWTASNALASHCGNWTFRDCESAAQGISMKNSSARRCIGKSIRLLSIESNSLLPFHRS